MLVGVAVVLAWAGTLVHAGWLAAGAPAAVENLVENWIYNGVLVVAGAACVAKAVFAPGVRAAWVAFGIGLLAWAAGDIYWVIALANVKGAPYPSWADAGYLMALPCFFVGIALLIKKRVGHFSAAQWFDGAIGALAAAAAGTAALAPALIGLTKGNTAAVLTNMAYPLGDLLLLAFIAGALAISGVRGAGSILLVGAGLAVWTGADVTYLYQEAVGSYTEGWLDSAWLVGGCLIGSSAVLGSEIEARTGGVYRSPLALPALFTILAASTLVWDHFERVGAISVWLAAAAIGAVVVRLAVSFRENDRLMHALHGDSITDELTGLGNRRRLFTDLEAALSADATSGRRYVFALFDLDGFKAYNDSFGHPAGDMLLRHLGENLAHVVRSGGKAYRLGGDEFCLLVELGSGKPASIVEAARAALSEEGEGFSIGASGGWVVLPDQAGTASDALRKSDHHMYLEKSRRSRRTAEQPPEALLGMFRQREPTLSTHFEGVARLASEVGRELGLDGEELDVLTRAAELHDIGKIAIPAEILHKPAPLDEIERELMRRHTLVGERILGLVPAMQPVAQVVRSSHERWDGTGYPDGLAHGDIPLAARIIFVCDAFDAMTSERPYEAAVSPGEALAELRRCAGTQFDPRIVDVVCRMIQDGGDHQAKPKPDEESRPRARRASSAPRPA